MRALTPQEIDNAPDWATHYSLCVNGYVMYQSFGHWSTEAGEKDQQCDTEFDYAEGDLQPIPHKEFDINSYTFSNESCLGLDSDGRLLFDGSHCGDDTCFNRDDIIAMAKLLKVTAEDLK